MFRRRRKGDEAAVEGDGVQHPDTEETQQADPAPTAPPERPDRSNGPFDVDEDFPELPRVDLAGMRIAIPDGLELRVDVDAEGQVASVALLSENSAMQVAAFAAPRSEGLWPEVRAEIAASLVEAGGQAEEVDGQWTRELMAGIPTEVPDHGVVLLASRFIGIDGPRWFLRALITGEAAAVPEKSVPFLLALQNTVVVRGGEPMAPRDPLPIRLPPEAADGAEAGSDDEAADGDGAADSVPTLPERGPEITEVR